MVDRQPAEVGPDEILDLTPLIRQVLRTRLADGDQVDDLLQTCLIRLLERRTALSSDTRAREGDRRRRNLPRLLEFRSPPDPADEATRAEDAAALRHALSKLAPQDRETLVAHDLDQVGTATLADRSASTPAGVASRLNRIRGRLRVEYLLAVERTTLPSPTCHPILVALSTADRRRQNSLRAGRHLAECQTCAILSSPLIERRRGTLFLLPLAVVAERLIPAIRWIRNHAAHSAAAATTVAVAAVAVIVLTGHRPPAAHHPSHRPPPPVAIDLVGGGNISTRRATGHLAPPGSVGMVLFAETGTDLNASARAVIASAARDIRQHHDRTVTVIGYTDSNGTASTNRTLSFRRAQAVLVALRHRLGGVNVQFHLHGEGQIQPIASNRTPQGRQLNRRVLILAQR